MNRCPNHKCRQVCDAKHGFCFCCGIAISLCAVCQQSGRLTINRGDGFYCRRCGSVLPPPARGAQTQTLFDPARDNFLAPALRIALNERSDSFPIISSQSNLWLLTSNNNLRIIGNHAQGLELYNSLVPGTGNLGFEALQSAIKYLEPLSAPIIFRDRLVLFGAHKMLSFSIHPHANRWLLDRREVVFPESWQPLFNSESVTRGDRLEIPIILNDRNQSTLLQLSREMLLGTVPLDGAGLLTSLDALLIGALDRGGNYYWAKDLKTGAGLIYYIRRRESGSEIVPINVPPLLFFVRPVMVGERAYAVTEEYRLIEFVLQQGEVIHNRKLSQLDRGARMLMVARDKIVVVVHESLFFFDLQTGELLSVATDIDASHLFIDAQGSLLAIHRNGQLVMINSAHPLERWGNEDATTDDSRIFDAFIANNSLYTLSENGEVCRFDFN